MNDLNLDNEELAITTAARAGLSPTDADVDRVRRGIEAAIAVGAATVAANGAARAANGAGAPGLDFTVARSTGRLTRWLLVSAFAASTGVAGYWAGHRAGVRYATVDAWNGIEVNAPRPSGPATVPAGYPEPARAVDEPQPAPGGNRARRVDPTRAAPTRAAPTRAAPGNGSAAVDESLDKEVQALRAIERALRDRQPRLALALLRQMDREIPHGKLTEEREALSSIARCAADVAPFDVNLAEEFAQRHAKSVYLNRVEQACARAGATRRAQD